MVDDDVAQRADRVVEVAAILDAEVLGHRDLDAREEVAAPDRLEHRVREPQVEDLLEAHLPEVVVDPVELRLVDRLVQLGGERTRRVSVVPERLLDDDARVVGQPGRLEPLDDGAEEERRDLEVEDRQLRALDRRADALVGRGVARSRPATYERRAAKRSKTCASSCSPVPSIDSRARCRSWSTVQSSTATPTIGQSSSPRFSSRYSDRNVITFARSPVMPNTTRTSACPLPSLLLPADQDSSGALVGEAAPGPVDNRLRPVLPRGEQREMDRAPREERHLPLHRSSAVQLRHRGAARDRGHRSLVVVLERLGLLARDHRAMFSPACSPA